MAAQLTLKRILLCVAITAAMGGFWLLQKPDVENSRKEAKRYFLRGEFQRALTFADEVLAAEPDSVETRILAARCSAKLDDANLALAYLVPISSREGRQKVKALLLTANLALNQLFDMRRAESAYRDALELDVDNIEALEGLVRLLATCGRRREAIPHLLNLVRLGYGSDFLAIAARGSGALNNIDLLQTVVEANPEDCSALTGLAMHAARAEDLDKAIGLCAKAVETAPTFAAANVYLGQYLLEAERFTQLSDWQKDLPDECLDFAETWRVLGYISEHHGQRQLALQRFLAASKLGPDLKDVYFRISQLLQQAGDSTTAKQFTDRLKKIQELETLQDRVFLAGPEDANQLLQMVDSFCGVGRIWEADGWIQVGVVAQPNNNSLRDRLLELVELSKDSTIQLESPDFNLASKVDADDYALADVIPTDGKSTELSDASTIGAISFRNDAVDSGFLFQYHPGVVGPTTHRMFEFTGGGIGVCDFDGDDFPDLFCSQGGLWETRGTNAGPSDQLFRNMRGASYEDVTETAGIWESSFGQGVAVGDIDGDGFSDIFVANIGQNMLWMNNGDGTFHRQQLPASDAEDEWTTSVLIADLTNNGLADIYAANYLHDNDLYIRVCSDDSGKLQACLPTHFTAKRDTLYLNNGSRHLSDQSQSLEALDRGKGLGVSAFSNSASGRLNVMVANDTTPNMLLTFEEDGSVVDRGFASGLAVNGQGKSEGCMGIAIGDVNDDGLFEILVTNFYNETNTFYHAVNSHLFEDRTTRVNLADASLPQLGFGCQLVDANMDGRLELIVANGHVDDLRHRGKPYEMPTQIFRQQSGAFVLSPAIELGSYFQQQYIGRSVVCADWNVDGQPDAVIGHLHKDYALLTNTSSKTGKSISLKLIGRQSSRDAIGVTVSCQMAEQIITRQITAGDGYHASNQHELWLGCGAIEQVSALTVTWPSGNRQVIHNVPTNSRYVIVEGRNTPFLLP